MEVKRPTKRDLIRCSKQDRKQSNEINKGLCIFNKLKLKIQHVDQLSGQHFEVPREDRRFISNSLPIHGFSHP